ncbi:hypothetical protein BMR04_16205, partial [Methylococcaceae bacterium HT3]
GRQLVGERLRTGLNFTLTPIIFGGVSVSGVEVVVETIQGGGFKYLFTVNEVLGSGETAEFGFTWDTRNKKSYTWQATVSPDAEDRDIDNNTMTVETIIVRPIVPAL